MERDGRRALVVVLDACGCGALPDAGEYGDEGTNTLAHVANAVGGLEVPTFWPKKKMQSVCEKSSSVQVPTGTPMLSGNATEVVSWHMLELSGRLLLP